MAGKAWAECEATGHTVRKQRAVSTGAPLTSYIEELLPTSVNLV